MTRPPLLTFAEAQSIGGALCDRWQAMAGEAPLERDDYAWADIVQFIMRKASDAVRAREVIDGR